MEPKVNTPAAPAPAGPKSSADYQAAAIASMASAPSEKGAPAAPPPAPEAKQAAPEAAPEEKKEALPDGLKKSFEKLAKDTAELRKAQESLKVYQKAFEGTDPATVSAVVKARMSKDPLSALTALGFTHQDYVDAINSQSSRAAPKAQPKAAAAPESEDEEVPPWKEALDRVTSELEALKTEKRNAQLEAGRTNTLSHMDKLAQKNPKLELVAGDPKAMKRALELAEEHVKVTGQAPASAQERDELLMTALEATEEAMAAEAAEWEARLTKRKGRAPVAPSGAPVTPPAASVQARLTTTNASSPANRTAHTPRTPEDYQAAAIAAVRAFDTTR